MQVRPISESSGEFPGVHLEAIGAHFPPGVSFVAYQPCPLAAGQAVPFPKLGSHRRDTSVTGHLQSEHS